MSTHVKLDEIQKNLKKARRLYWYYFFTFQFVDWRFYAAQIKKLKFDIIFYKRLESSGEDYP